MGSFGGLAISYSLTTVVRGIGSIPGHALWTGLSGVSIGWYLCTKRGIAPSDNPTRTTLHGLSLMVLQAKLLTHKGNLVWVGL